MEANWITALATIAIAGLTGFLAWENFKLRKETKNLYQEQEKRFRRETTINLLTTWLRNFDRQSILVRMILSELKKEDLEKVFRMERLTIYRKDYKEEFDKIFNLLSVLFESDTGLHMDIRSIISLKGSHSAKLRALMMEVKNSYININT